MKKKLQLTAAALVYLSMIGCKRVESPVVAKPRTGLDAAMHYEHGKVIVDVNLARKTLLTPISDADVLNVFSSALIEVPAKDRIPLYILLLDQDRALHAWIVSKLIDNYYENSWAGKEIASALAGFLAKSHDTDLNRLITAFLVSQKVAEDPGKSQDEIVQYDRYFRGRRGMIISTETFDSFMQSYPQSKIVLPEER